MSQPTLTRVIRRVEKHFGAQLFERSATGMSLNRRGEAALPHVRTAVAALEAARREVDALTDPARDTVRLDFMHSLGTWMVPDLLRSYRDVYPQVKFELHQGSADVLVARLLNDDTDLALIGPRPVTSGLGWHKLDQQRLAVAFPSAHPLASDAPVDLADVAEEAWVGMLPGYGTRLLLDQLSSEAGFAPRLVFESMELSTVAGLVSAGLGVALLPMDDPYLHVAGLVLRPIDPPVYRELGVVWREDASPLPPVDLFREFIVAMNP